MNEDDRERQRYVWRLESRRKKIAKGVRPGNARPRKNKVLCVHCKVGRPNQRAGLCVKCYWDPQIIALYPPLPFSRKGAGIEVPRPGAKCEPTHHKPGTAGKVEALAARVEACLPLWHPDDAPAENERDGCFDDRLAPARVCKLSRAR